MHPEPSNLPDLLVRDAMPPTMGSREIAELTEKRHDNVVRDIKAMIVGLYGHPDVSFDEGFRDPSVLRDQANSVTWTRDGRGYVTAFDLDKEHTITLVTGYDVRMRKRIVDRWLQLEVAMAAPKLPDLSDPAVLLSLLAEQARGRIEDQRRTVEAEVARAAVQGQLDCLSATEGSVPLRDAAKTLGFSKCDDIFEALRERGWIYRRESGGPWIGHQDKVRAGLLEHIPVTYRDRYGTEHTKSQVVATPRGLVKLAENFAPILVH